MPDIIEVIAAFLKQETLANPGTQSDGVTLTNQQQEVATWVGGKALVLRQGSNYNDHGLHAHIKGLAPTLMALAETPNDQREMNL